MREVEVKIINYDMDAFRRMIASLGAKSIFKGDTSSIILDFKDRRLNKKDCLLRLRSFDKQRCELTFKGPKIASQYRIRKEINVEIKDFDDVLLVMKSLGLNEVNKIYKYRESYALDLRVGRRVLRYHIDIDDYKLFPEFAEIESRNEKELALLINMLKIPKDKLYNGSTYDIFKMYGIKSGLEQNL